MAAIARFGAQMVRVEGTNDDSVAEGHARCSRSSGNVSDRGLREVAPIPTRLWSAVEHRSGFRKGRFRVKSCSPYEVKPTSVLRSRSDAGERPRVRPLSARNGHCELGGLLGFHNKSEAASGRQSG